MPDKKGFLAFQRAQRWLQGGERAYEDARWDDVVYCSQMAVEQAVKAVLLREGLIFKRVHDVSDEFLSLKDKKALPEEFRKNIEEIADVLIFLTDQRALAGYGFEEEVDVSFFKKSAPDALKKAKWALIIIKIVFLAEG